MTVASNKREMVDCKYGQSKTPKDPGESENNLFHQTITTSKPIYTNDGLADLIGLFLPFHITSSPVFH